jgi:hypothetical protein
MTTALIIGVSPSSLGLLVRCRNPVISAHGIRVAVCVLLRVRWWPGVVRGRSFCIDDRITAATIAWLTITMWTISTRRWPYRIFFISAFSWVLGV